MQYKTVSALYGHSEEFNTDGMLDIYLFENEQLLEQLQDIVLEQKDADSFFIFSISPEMKSATSSTCSTNSR